MINHVNETRFNNYIDCLLNKDNENLYIKYIINNVDINEFDKIFNNYIISHNKKFDFYYINCEFEIETDNFLANIEINFHHNTDYINIKNYLFFYTESRGINLFNISQMIINTISCLCNMTYKYYLNNQKLQMNHIYFGKNIFIKIHYIFGFMLVIKQLIYINCLCLKGE